MRPIRMRAVRPGTVGAMMLLVGLIGCGGDDMVTNPPVTNPLFEPEITNITDDYRFQATNVRDVTQTLDYTWQNTGTMANIDQASTVTQGSATLTVFDGSGTQVYSKGLQVPGSFVTATGAPGAWRIRVSLNDTYGTLNFRAQKGG